VPGLYPVLGLLFGAAPRLLYRVPLRVLAGVALATAVVAVAGIVLGFRPYPFTNAVVVAFCITAGTSIGRAVPPRRRPMAALLAVLAALDTVQVFAADPHADGPSAMRLWTMLLLVTPLGSSAIGFGDLAVVAAIGEHWRRRGGNLAWSVLPGAMGLALVDAFSILVFKGNLPLLPFLLVAWLLTEAAALVIVHRRKARPGGGWL
jgi:hypothetical protein